MSDVLSSEPGKAGGAGGESGPRSGNATRRSFTAAYKLAIVEEYYALTEFGARGALLRREGLYQSHLDKWRRARDRGALSASGPVRKPPGLGGSGKPVGGSGADRRLTAENARLASELAKTRAVLEVMGKAHALLEILSESAEQEQPRPR